MFYILVTLAAGGVFAAVVGLTMLGVVAPWSGRFYSLWDTGPFTYSFSTGFVSKSYRTFSVNFLKDMLVFTFQLFHPFLSINRQCGHHLLPIFISCQLWRLQVFGTPSRYAQNTCLQAIFMVFRTMILPKFSWLYTLPFRVISLGLWFVLF